MRLLTRWPGVGTGADVVDTVCTSGVSLSDADRARGATPGGITNIVPPGDVVDVVRTRHTGPGDVVEIVLHKGKAPRREISSRPSTGSASRRRRKR